MLWRIQKQPGQAVKEVLSSVPNSILLDCTKTVADLAMGDGSYLAEIAKMRVANGATLEEAQATLYGFESSLVYLAAAKKLNGLQYANLAIMKPEKDLDLLDMKFDVIIGNPPYASGANNRFFAKFFEKAAELLNDGGWFAMLAPTKGGLVGSEYSRKPLDQLGWFKIKLGMRKWFPGIGTTIALFVAQKGRDPGLIEVVVDDAIITLDRDTPIPMEAFPSADLVLTLKKFFSTPSKISFEKVRELKETEEFAFIPRQVTRYSPHKPRGGFKCVDVGINNYANREIIDGRLVVTNSPESYGKLLKSDLYRFIWAHSFTSNFIPPFVWKLTPQLKSSSLDEQAEEIGLTKAEKELVRLWAEQN